MHEKNKKNIIFFCLVCIFLLSANFVFAIENIKLEIKYPTFLGQEINNTSTLADYVCYLFGLATTICLFMTVIVIAGGGVYYLISYGQGKFTSEAKDWIKSGILGLLVIVCASLILYNINPKLNKCNFPILSLLDIVSDIDDNTVPKGIEVSTYKEIPIGSLTETLLTRTLPCYSYDHLGNPIFKPSVVASTGPGGDEKYESTKDRIKCLTESVDGAQKTAQVASQLADKISSLMQQCDCNKYGKCEATQDCLLKNGLDHGTNSDCDGECKGSGGSCIMPSGPTDPLDCCPPIAYDLAGNEIKDPDTGKTLSVKDVIEHGPIELSFNVVTGDASSCPANGCCTLTDKTDGAIDTEGNRYLYRGLDEFRCDSSKPDPLYPGKNQLCANIARSISMPVETGLPYPTYEIQPGGWFNLTLWQRMTYFIETINSDKKTIENDVGVLDKAREDLNKCYFAIPHVDLIKTFEGEEKDKRIILKEPIDEKYKDPLTGETLNTSKYCSGFNYANSSCYKKCNDMCPDSSSEALTLYSGCSDGKTCLNNAYNKRPCPNSGYSSFEECIGSCIDSCRDNFENTGDECFNNLNADCIAYFKQIGQDPPDPGTCRELCTQKYLPCSYEYDFCAKIQYENNSQCILDENNVEKCLFEGKQFQNCQKNSSDQGNADYCINNAYLCKNGSNEYAGYPDCQDPNTRKTNCSNKITKGECEYAATAGGLKIECVWDGKICSQNYSSSFFSNNPDTQKCKNPYEISEGKTCVEGSPETAKCPTSSRCPECECDKINESVFFAMPQKSYPGVANYCMIPFDNPNGPRIEPVCLKGESCNGTVCTGSNTNGTTCSDDTNCEALEVCSFGLCVKKSNVGKNEYFKREIEVSANNLVGAQCNQYLYNIDPLTFYCPNEYTDKEGNKSYWWNDPKREGQHSIPVGKEKVVPIAGEIPVGQTVDNARGWAGSLMANLENFINNAITPFIDQMTKIGKAIETSPVQDYCKCNAKLETGESICKPDCKGTPSEPTYSQWYECPSGYTSSDAPNTYETSICEQKHLAKVTIKKTTTCTKNPCTINCTVCSDPDDPSTCFPKTTKCTTTCTNNPCSFSYTPPAPPGSCSNNCTQNCVGFCSGTCDNNCSFKTEKTYSCPSGETESSGVCTKTIPVVLHCKCEKAECRGKPCLQEQDYLSQLWNYYGELKDQYIDFFNMYVVSEQRSDIFKQLTYSRQTMDKCSTIGSSFGKSTRVLSCTRAEDELVSPINESKLTRNDLRTLVHNNNVEVSVNGYCYGKELGKSLISSEYLDLTDNWFCCEQRQKNPSTSNSPSQSNNPYDYYVEYNGL